MSILLRNRKQPKVIKHKLDWMAKLLEVSEDWEKAKNGNKAAATRARKVLQGLKGNAQELRQELHILRSYE